MLTWNPDRGIWETQEQSLLCDHADTFTENWPTGGVSRRGTAWARDPFHAAAVHSALFRPVALLPTPDAYEPMRGSSVHPDRKRAGRHQVCLSDVTEHTMLPTPRATDGTKGGPNQRGSKGERMLPSAVHHLLPTPKASDGTSHSPTTSGRPVEKSTALATQVLLQAGFLEHRRTVPLLPTPTTFDAKDNLDVKNQMLTRDSPGLPCIPALLGWPEETWPKTELRNTQSGKGSRRRAGITPPPKHQEDQTETDGTLF